MTFKLCNESAESWALVRMDPGSPTINYDLTLYFVTIFISIYISSICHEVNILVSTTCNRRLLLDYKYSQIFPSLLF